MEQLRKLGQIGRQHYEKLILSASLVIFAVAVYFLYQASIVQRKEIREIPAGYENQKVKPVHRADLSDNDAALRLVETAPTINFSHPHFLFNPLQWETRAGSDPRKLKSSDDVGPRAMQIVRISPLLLTIAYVSPSTSGTEPDIKVNGYWTISTNELVSVRSRDRLIRAFVSESETNRQALFILRGVKGDPKEPTELQAELKEAPGEQFTFAPNKPYTRTLGHEAELLYKPSGKKHPGLRKDLSVDIDGELYKIVDITPSAVVLSDDSNGKQYTITTFVR